MIYINLHHPVKWRRRCKGEGPSRNLLRHLCLGMSVMPASTPAPNYRYLQRVAGRADARRALAGRASPFQESATPQMADQRLARRESPGWPRTVLRRLTRGVALACAPRLVLDQPGGSEGSDNWAQVYQKPQLDDPRGASRVVSGNDCSAEGTTPGKGEVERRLEPKPRATHGRVHGSTR